MWSEHFPVSNILGFHAEQALFCHSTHTYTDDGSGLKDIYTHLQQRVEEQQSNEHRIGKQ